MALCLLTLNPRVPGLLHPPLPGVSNCFKTFKIFESFKNNVLVFIYLYLSSSVFICLYLSLIVFNLS